MEARRLDPLIVSPGEGGRLDRFLARHLSGRSRATLRAAIAAGGVLVNGRPARKGRALQPGDLVQIDLSILATTLAAQPDLPVRIIYEDATLVAVDKPAGMPSVALRAGDRDTLANYLIAYAPELSASGATPFEAGLVHRLDTATSGVLIAARTAAAWRNLRGQFRRRAADKLYLAIVAGDLARRGALSTPIAHRPRHPREMCVCPHPDRARALRARPARTQYRPLRRAGAATLVAIRITTGVRHQIRVHLASIDHPVIGDPLYGGRSGDPAVSRLLLHAARLGITHPVSGERMALRSRLPDDFTAALSRLVDAPRGAAR